MVIIPLRKRMNNWLHSRTWPYLPKNQAFVCTTYGAYKLGLVVRWIARRRRERERFSH